MARKYKVLVHQTSAAKGLDLPSYAHPGEDVGLDLYASEEVVIKPRSGADVPTGLRFAIPRGKYLHIYGKGSSARLGLAIHLSIVDQGYTGELTLHVWNMSEKEVLVPRGKCIAQGVFRSFDEVTLKPISLLEIESIRTSRRSGRMNSTGRGI